MQVPLGNLLKQFFGASDRPGAARLSEIQRGADVVHAWCIQGADVVHAWCSILGCQSCLGVGLTFGWARVVAIEEVADL